MEKITVGAIREYKARDQRIAALTAYDFPVAGILDEAGIDIILVGDSLGNVVLGLPGTRGVTMSDMLHHTAAVKRGVRRALLVADVPFRSLSVANARKLARAGAEAVKVEGVKGLKLIRRIAGAGIPVMGHLGYLPQTGGKPSIIRSESLIAEARALEKAGAFAIVLEMVEPQLAKRVTQAIKIPTIGIGSGPACDGQILVTHDLIGLSAWSPRFVKPKSALRGTIRKIVKEYIAEVR